MGLRSLLALLILLLAATSATAAPVGGAIAAIAGFFSAGGVAAFLVKTAFVIAVNVGMGLIQQARAGKAARKREPIGVTLSVQMGDTQPRTYLLGTYATAGRRIYIGTWGSADNTPNAYVTDVIELSCLPSNAGPQGLQSAWIGDVQCTILWNEPHPDGRGFPVQQFRRGGTDYLWLKYLDGSQVAADPFLMAVFGGHAERPFKSSMVGRGCQAVILTARFNQDLFQQGLPQGVYQPTPMPLYDLRQDSTNGGSGAQRWTNSGTWASSDNLATMIYNVARGIYYDGRWLHGGRNFPQHRLPASSWIAALNEADRLLGGRRQFRGGLEVPVDQEPLETIEDLRLGCAGRLAEVGGIIKLLVGAPAAAVYSFDDSGIVVTSEQDFQPFPSISSTYNTATAVYPEPLQRWTYKDAPEKSSPALVARDGGQRLPIDLRFDAVPFSDQVQSLMKTMIDEEQRWRVHEVVLPPSASALEPNDVVSWSSERNSYSNKKFLIVRSTRLRGSLHRTLIKELDPSDYDPPEIITPPVVGWLGPILPPPQPMFGWQVEPDVLRDADGNPWRPTIRISAAPDQDDVQFVWVQVRLAADQSIVFESTSTPYAPPYSWLINAVFKGSTDYEARGRFTPYTRRETEWSDWMPVRTPNVGDGDLIADLSKIGADVKAIFTKLYSEIGDLRSSLERLLTDHQLEGAVTETQRRRVEVAVENARAFFEEEIVVIADDLAAIASQTTEIGTQLNERFAGGMVKFEAVASPAGVDVSYAILLKAGSTGAFMTTGMLLQLYTQAGVVKSRIAFDTQQFVVTDTAGNASSPLVFENGQLKLNVANIGLVNSAIISLGGGRVRIDENGIVVRSS
ncbi:phage tail protein [Pseudorhizobium halotolerans]|uniref:Phage tail protein n=1 Tax=Pseudorhizobium halotolerans TaxID=1233081 RepID=A0ABM8PYZ2_9HYPH|nr:phage tail protein [Pseudorhizobium halotolerans]CAD7055493.1 phage tail protein [Pseudorhizobium halotolerans]